MSRSTALVALALTALLSGCGAVGTTPPSVEVAPAPATSLQVGEAAAKAHPIDVTLKLQLPDPTWSYDATAVEVDDVNRQIVLRPQMKRLNPALPDGVVRMAPQVVVPHTVTSSFTPGQAGVYRVQVVGAYKPLAAEVTVAE